MSILNSTLHFLGCPNDANSLSISNKKLFCNFCKHEFRIIDENIIELLPKTSFEIDTENNTTKSYSEYYLDLQKLGHSSDSKKRLWGTKTKTVPEGFVDTLRNFIFNNSENKTVCDVGAGSGDYSLLLAKNSKYVFHCDLDLEAIMFAQKTAKKRGLNNILFIRCDYFSLPFQDESLPSMTCIDILLRGHEHDTKLLTEISKKLQVNGTAILDFHSKERMKINKNLEIGGCYSKNEISSVLSKFNFKIMSISGMGFAPTFNKLPKFLYTLTNLSLKIIFPPARWIVKIIKEK